MNSIRILKAVCERLDSCMIYELREILKHMNVLIELVLEKIFCPVQ